MNKEKVACPHCGYQINNEDEQCSNCGEFFVEPNLSEFKMVSIPMFLACEAILTAFGLPFFYSLIWMIFNHKNIYSIAIPKDIKKFNILYFWFGFFVVLTVIVKYFIIIDFVLEVLLAYRVLRIIEKFTLKKYNSPVTHHELGMIFFRTVYVIYYLDTYSIRVKDPHLRYCLNVDALFKYILILALVYVLLYFLGLFSIPMYKI